MTDFDLIARKKCIEIENSCKALVFKGFCARRPLPQIVDSQVLMKYIRPQKNPPLRRVRGLDT